MTSASFGATSRQRSQQTIVLLCLETKSINFPNTSDELSNLFDKLQRLGPKDPPEGRLCDPRLGFNRRKTTTTLYVMIDGAW